MRLSQAGLSWTNQQFIIGSCILGGGIFLLALSSGVALLPAAGFGCDVSHDGALARALLEACQARLSAISGAREDITRRAYPATYDRDHLASWRQHLQNPARALRFEQETNPRAQALDDIVAALQSAGARAAIVVPLYEDDATGIRIVRVVAPPLRPAP